VVIKSRGHLKLPDDAKRTETVITTAVCRVARRSSVAESGVGWPKQGIGLLTVRYPSRKDTVMGLGDKIQNAGEEAAGKVKEATGKATDNESLEAEGKGDQASANVKQAGEKVKDAVKNVVD
jgi:uncharacterized protein YjbJ (UPF0337 family)